MITEVKKNLIHFNDMQLLHKLATKIETEIFQMFTIFRVHVISTSLLQVYGDIRDLK
jgi:hypothetical protein